MRKLAILATLLAIVGCGITENRRVVVRRDISAVSSVAATTSSSDAATSSLTFGWREPYYADRENHYWDEFIPKTRRDPVAEDLEFFNNNVLRWPAEMRPAYVHPEPEPAPAPAPETPKESATDPILYEVY